jgi:hypothetical protein
MPVQPLLATESLGQHVIAARSIVKLPDVLFFYKTSDQGR